MSPENREAIQDVPPVAALGVSREIHMEMLRVALHTICTMMFKKNSSNKKQNQERLDEAIRQS